MLVYRVATAERMPYGVPGGPYNGPETDEWQKDMAWAHSNRDHPNPYDDGGLHGILDDEFCAFASMELLTSWFKDWLDKLHEAGYLKHVYDVPDEHVRFGEKQVVAKLKLGALVRTEPILVAA